AHSVSELRDKLRRRAEKLADIDTVVARLKEHGYLNDRQFAENYAARRLDSEGLGKMRVVRDLRQRRVAGGVAGKGAEKALNGVDEVQLIEQYLARKYRNKQLDRLLADPKELASAYRRLRYAGFTSGNAIRVLKSHARQAELLESLEGDEDQAAGSAE